MSPPGRASRSWLLLLFVLGLWLCCAVLQDELPRPIDSPLDAAVTLDPPSSPPDLPTESNVLARASSDPLAPPDSGVASVPPPSLDAAFCPPSDEVLQASARIDLSEALRRDPTLAPILAKIRSAKMGTRARREALAQARERVPDDPSLSLLYGLAAVHSPELQSAAEALDQYLKAFPQNTFVSRRRALLGVQLDIQRDFDQSAAHGITLAYPRSLGSHHVSALLDRIDQSLSDAAQLTATPRRTELYAVLFRDRSELLAVTCSPSWAGGIYSGTLLLALDEDKLPDDRTIRHESFHAQVTPHATGPHWLDEGLAQYFEEGGSLRWQPVFEVMARQGSYIPFSSLNETFSAFEDRSSASLAYAQSLAMVHLLVERRGEAVISFAIDLMRKKTPPGEIITQLGLREEDLLELLRRRSKEEAEKRK